ncbi:MAG: 2-amino-4-hydroxy-6-hydroxymethyldihydropteridine diphosphokinase [Proteobacteria bacterium]|nr:MAG: 2-amino-4-hydroxy-6-hydroxymethyldihydropteridine diphosphokinase [Pseudomonadota bacterium]
MAEVYVAAGSNIEPERHLRRALVELAATYGPLRVSPAYRNKAVGFAGDDFVNLAVAFTTERSPEEVRASLQEIERHCGRPADAPRWAPRSMDLDILLFGDRVSQAPGLVFPRPDLVKRAYMLKPMADIAPDLVHPTLGRTMRALWEEFVAGSGGTPHEMVPVRLDPLPPDAAPAVDG